jgi:hypothetical protein
LAKLMASLKSGDVVLVTKLDRLGRSRRELRTHWQRRRVLPVYLGHKNIQHTVRYTELSPDRFKDFWR